MITDQQRHILRVNPAFTRMTGYTAREAVGQTPAILKSGRQDRGFYERMWADLNTSGHWQGEIWNRRKSGEIYPEWLTITAVRDGEGELTHYVSTFSDICAAPVFTTAIPSRPTDAVILVPSATSM